MQKLLIGCGAALLGIAAATAPAHAQSAGQTFVSPEASSNGARVTRIDGDRRPHRRGGASTVVLGNWSGGEWALYNNRTFEPGSYNDWWHDRPDRADPRWISNNHNCDRMWWSGGTWRC